MGNAQQKKGPISLYVHPRLGPVKRIEERKDRFSLVYEVILENKKLYDDWAFQLQKISQISDEILFLPTFHEYTQTNFCGTGGLAKLHFEDYLYSLHPQIVNRSQIKRPFNQQELLYLFYSLVKIESILQAKGKHIGDIKPENILVNEDGYVKVISHYSWPGDYSRISNWQKDSQRFFLAPQEIEERFRRRDINISNNFRNQSQVFSIALTILEAGTLKESSELYGYTSEYRLNEPKLKEHLDLFEIRYSKELSILVRQMLLTNPRKRIKAETAYEILKPYEYSILNLEEIQIRMPVFESIPRVDREEKISIKKLGESQLSHQHQESVKYEQSFGQHTIRPPNNMKISPNSTPPTPLSPHSAQPNFNPFSNTLDSGFQQSVRQSFPSSQQQQPPINYQLVNENTNFIRPMAPTSLSPFYERHIMQNSLPLSLPQHQQNSNLNRPQYITQNSMVNDIGRVQNQHHFTNY